MSRDSSPVILTAKDALENIHKFSLAPPRVNRFSHKKEAPILFDGKVACIQIGSLKNPLYVPFGASRWSQPMGKFVTIEDNDPQWLFASAAADGGNHNFSRKLPSTKLQAMLTLHDYDSEGTQGYYAFKFVSALVDRIVDGLVNGVPDANSIDPDTGKPKIVPTTDLANAPQDPVAHEQLMRQMLVSPLQPPQGEYAPNLKSKIRSVVRRDSMGEFACLDGDVLNGRGKDHDAFPPREHFTHFKKGSRGVFVLKISALQFRRSEMGFNLEICKSMIMPTESMFKNVQIKFDDDDGDDDPMAE